MNDLYRSYQELVERLADAAAVKKGLDPKRAIAYKYGFLVGVLVSLAYNDSEIRHKIISRLKRLS